MRYDEFIERVRERGEFGSTEEAEAATRATLSTLGEYLTDREGPELARRLPEGVSEHLLRQPPERSEIFSAEDFLQLVGEREGVNVGEARYHVRAVMDVLGEAVGREHLAGVVERQFPSEFAPILGPEG